MISSFTWGVILTLSFVSAGILLCICTSDKDENIN